MAQLKMRPFNLNDVDSSSITSAEKKNKVLGKRSKNRKQELLEKQMQRIPSRFNASKNTAQQNNEEDA